jgi:GAF domain-containing protein
MVDGVQAGEHMPECVLYRGRASLPDGIDSPWRPADDLLAGGPATLSPAILLVDASLLERIGDVLAVPDHMVIVAADTDAERALGRRSELSLASVRNAAARQVVLNAACLLATARYGAMRADEEFRELSRIGMDLMRERDRKALLRQIVAQGKRLTHSDAGGLLLMRTDDAGRRWLRPVLYAFDSLGRIADAPMTHFPVDETSIIGHACISKQPLVIADAYDLPRDAVYEQSTAFDERYGYRRRSMLVVPMLDQRDRVLGLLLFMNRKTDPHARITSKEAADQYVVEYTDHEVRLARLLASQAAVAVENARLYAQIERTLESFVKASVSAIDLRDPVMAGHSVRVAALTTNLAAAVERTDSGPYRDVTFTRKQMRELRFAALLHDFGKVAVSEDVLLKAKKLPPVLRERVDARFDLIRSTMELASCVAVGSAGAADGVAALEELERCRQVVRDANEPTVLDTPAAVELLEIAQRTFERPGGSVVPYITPEELHFLQLSKGTLDDAERAEVQSHVTKTYRFLSNIPWTDDLKHMATYAYGHHEALNGSGYPRHLTSADIPHSDAPDHRRRHVRRADRVGSSVQAGGDARAGSGNSPGGSRGGAAGRGDRAGVEGEWGVPGLSAKRAFSLSERRRRLAWWWRSSRWPMPEGNMFACAASRDL